MSQLSRAKAYVAELMTRPSSQFSLRMLDEIIAEAQNPPPEGGADGSINEETFNQLRAAADAIRNFQKAHAKLFATPGTKH